MAINVVSVEHNGVLLSDIMLSTRCDYIVGECSHLNLLTMFPLKVDAQKVFRCLQIFLKQC